MRSILLPTLTALALIACSSDDKKTPEVSITVDFDPGREQEAYLKDIGSGKSQVGSGAQKLDVALKNPPGGRLVGNGGGSRAGEGGVTVQTYTVDVFGADDQTAVGRVVCETLEGSNSAPTYRFSASSANDYYVVKFVSKNARCFETVPGN